ncbi:tRNA (guanine(9)-N(1))-methyltransferase [Starmerella bacillaris]|uniref:tRNA (guanine(9)-N1)-methyltransferase n=1 Tax=Starmerella bacillaris TaxID=1247836 RepID=A0AAV5RLM6_STABA|nr:tRNA (guanine(9)-N(1))-methyltransferase [Starmerella bacillaris]
MAKTTFDGKPVPEGMSRKAFKKLVKQERMEAGKEEFLAKRRLKRKEKRAHTHRHKPPPLSEQTQSGVNVVIDCGFDEKMEDGERVSLVGQLTRCYSVNRRTLQPVNLVIANFNKKLKSRFENELYATHKLWENVQFCEGDLPTIEKSGCCEPSNEFSTENMVYLTGDATETLSTLDPGTTYIVGGIVDKDRHKNLCLNKAKALNIRTARLPIDEHVKISGRKILTTNQAFELLVRWVEHKDWKVSFESTIPSRKQEVKVKQSEKETATDADTKLLEERTNDDSK